MVEKTLSAGDEIILIDDLWNWNHSRRRKRKGSTGVVENEATHGWCIRFDGNKNSTWDVPTEIIAKR